MSWGNKKVIKIVNHLRRFVVTSFLPHRLVDKVITYNPTLRQEVYMSNEYQSVEGLIDGVKGTTEFLSSIFSLKPGLVLLLIVLAVIAANILY